MHSLEEKNHLSNELERLKKKLEEATEAKAREAEWAGLRNELNSLRYTFDVKCPFLFSDGLAERAAENAARNRKCSQTNASAGNSFQYSTNGSTY